MTSDDRILLSCYEQIAALNENHGVYLVQHKGSNSIYVKKKLSVYNPAVFHILKDHPVRGIPRIEEVIEDGDSLIVIEEYISGKTLRTILDDGNLFPEKDAIEIIMQLCKILSSLHQFNPVIVHRDIKPSNIILTPDGDVRLIDMNAARQLQADKEKDTSLIGTVGYAAPEQYGFGTSGVQADLYAVGIVLNEMILGVSPLKAVPQGKLGRIIQKCTMLDPKDRYPSAQSLALDLEHILIGTYPAEIENNISSQRFSVPGFRSGNPSHIIIAIAGYLMILYVSLTLRVENASSITVLWFERIICLIACLAVVFFTCNYKSIWKKLRIDRIQNIGFKHWLL